MNRRLAAILAADVVGYSALMAADEKATLAAVKSVRREVFEPAVAAHRGRLVKLMGDGALVEFASVVDAVTCAAKIQENIRRRRAQGGQDGRIRLRIGISIGDVLADGDDVYGDGVNIAARLEAEADPDGVTISGDAFRQIRGKTALRFTDLGPRRLRNIPEPVRLYRLEPDPPEPDENAFEILTGRKPDLPDKPSIVVLPFSNKSADAEQDYFADGITEDIITELTRFAGLLVIARNSAFAYRGGAADLGRISRDLGVRFVARGSVRRAGDRVRVSVQLIDAQTGRLVWAERYDRELQDIFSVQEDITSSVVASIAPQIEKAEMHRVRVSGGVNMSAYDGALKGQALVNQGLSLGDPETLLDGIATAARALEIDPGCQRALFAQAKGYAYCFLYRWGPDPDAAVQLAWQTANRLLDVDPYDPNGLTIRGVISQFRGGHETAIADLRRAVELSPNSTLGLFMLGWAESLEGYPEAARAHVTRGLRISPRDNALGLGTAYLALAQASFAEGDHAGTRKWGRLAIQMHPHAPIRRALMIASCALDGLAGEAEKHRAALAGFAPDFLPSLLDGRIALFRSARLNDLLLKGLRLSAGA